MNLTATSFDASNARECADASARAYAAWSVACLATDTQVLVQESADYIVVAFRGTSNLRDWITDAQFTQRLLVEEADGAECKVHHGFLDAYESVISDLGHYLSSIHRHRPVFVTGHSLGGALAILAALELKRQGFDVRQVYTFGQPRVGNKNFANLYNWSLKENTFAVVNEGDPVPLLPPLLNGYRDCGVEIYLRRDYTTRVNPFIGWQLFEDIAGAVNAWRKCSLGLLPNHFIATYQTRLQLLK